MNAESMVGPWSGSATAYEGPVVTSVFAYAGRAVRVVRPSDPDRLLDDPGVLAWNRRDDYMPYWAYLWPGAFLLAEAVARAPCARASRPWRSGAGWGWPGWSRWPGGSASGSLIMTRPP